MRPCGLMHLRRDADKRSAGRHEPCPVPDRLIACSFDNQAVECLARREGVPVAKRGERVDPFPSPVTENAVLSAIRRGDAKERAVEVSPVEGGGT